MDFLKAYALKPNFEKDIFKSEGTKCCYLLREFTMIEKVFLACLWNLDKMRRGFLVGCYQNHRKKALDWTPLSCGLLQLRRQTLFLQEYVGIPMLQLCDYHLEDKVVL